MNKFILITKLETKGLDILGKLVDMLIELFGGRDPLVGNVYLR